MKFFRIVCCVCFMHFLVPAASCQNLDIDVLKAINPQYPTSGFWQAFSNTHVIVAASVSVGPLIYSLVTNDSVLRYKSYEVLIGIGISTISTTVLKKIFNRTRPVDQYPNEIYVVKPGSKGYSFPSGHTSLAFATATSLTLAYRKWYITLPAYMWAACVAYSRMYLGRHYPSDVLGGALVGAGSSFLGHWVNKKLFYPKPVSASQTNSF